MKRNLLHITRRALIGIATVFSLAALSQLQPGIARAAGTDLAYEGYPVVTPEELDRMRGGYRATANGMNLDFSFGISRATYVNGELVSTTTLNVPSINAVGAAQLSNVSTIVQNGPGNSIAAGTVQVLPSGAFTVIQNSLDNQVLKQITTINASVKSLDAMRAAQFANALNIQLRSGLR